LAIVEVEIRTLISMKVWLP